MQVYQGHLEIKLALRGNEDKLNRVWMTFLTYFISITNVSNWDETSVFLHIQVKTGAVFLFILFILFIFTLFYFFFWGRKGVD